MPPALWLIVIPLGAIPVVYLFRRTGIGAIIATGVALALAWLTMQTPLGTVLNLLGRPIELNQLSQIMLALLFAATALLFLIAFPLKKSNTAATNTKRGQTFHTVALATLAAFVAAGLSRHLGIAAIFIEIAAIFTVFIIQGRQMASTRAAQRFLVLMSLALPLFLLAAWRMDQYQLSGGSQPANYLQQTTLFISFGFALWLGVWPFHSWQSTTAAEASPPAAAFVLIAFPVVAFSSLINLLIDAPWLTLPSSLPWVMIIAGVGTAFVAGVLAAVQRGLNPLMGYTALYDLGLTLIILGMGGKGVVAIVLAGLIIRVLALALITASLVVIKRHTADDGFAQITGLAHRLPLATIGVVVGGLTLVGVPLTAGFPLRWYLLQAVAEVDPQWPILLMLAGLGVGIGYLRGLRALLSPNKKEPTEEKTSDALSLQEPPLFIIIMGVLTAACILLGLFPSLLIEPLQELSADIFVPLQFK